VSHIAGLRRKYEMLGALRRARARGEAVPARGVFKALATEFPGALNELDMLPLEEIDARAEALGRAAAGGPIEAWMGWMGDYHALMRAALRLKPRVARGEGLDEERAEALARAASEQAGVAVDAAFVRAVGTPPEGRLNRVVFARLAEVHGTPAETIKRTLFPRSRRL
jgi:hypothetical protein